MELEFSSNGLEPRTILRVGIGRFFLNVPKRALTKMSQMIRSRNLQSLGQLFASLKTGLRLVDSFLQRIDLLDLQVIIGTGDPFFSALGCGGVWGLLGPFLTALSTGNRLRVDPQIMVQPDFKEPQLKVHLHCIFRFRLGQIIINELRRVTFAWYARTFS
ncbi:MAG: DUF2953 domain-containing protein [Firmicutes bacterium]|nr:DUF2953 domain-containing protein [Bacillota bacterium]